jgi:hypothetical protein
MSSISMLSIFDFRKSYGALFRLLHFNCLVGLRGEIQRLQYFDIRHFLLSSLTAIYSEVCIIAKDCTPQ